METCISHLTDGPDESIYVRTNMDIFLAGSMISERIKGTLSVKVVIGTSTVIRAAHFSASHMQQRGWVVIVNRDVGPITSVNHRV